MELCQITEADVEELMQLCAALYEESPNYKECKYEPAIARTWFFRAINEPDSYFCRKVVKDGKIIATMVGFIVTMTFSLTKSGGDVGVFVLPEYRGCKAALMLVIAYEKWLKAHECKRSILSITAGINDDKAESFYKKLGYRDFGKVLIKEIT